VFSLSREDIFQKKKWSINADEEMFRCRVVAVNVHPGRELKGTARNGWKTARPGKTRVISADPRHD
jgi:hypothetical protein